MAGNKFGTYFTISRSKRKEALEEERRRRAEELGRRPEIVDPSFELFGNKTTQSALHDRSSVHDIRLPTQQQAQDDWAYQTRRTNQSPEQFQLDPYCDVTPKSSTSSNVSKTSSAPSAQDYEMGWDGSNQVRPRPQSFLPASITAAQTSFMEDFSRASAYQSRRHTMLPQRTSTPVQQNLPSLPRQNTEPVQPSRSSYKLEASLSKPFSMSDPLDFSYEYDEDDQKSSHGSSTPR